MLEPCQQRLTGVGSNEMAAQRARQYSGDDLRQRVVLDGTRDAEQTRTIAWLRQGWRTRTRCIGTRALFRSTGHLARTGVVGLIPARRKLRAPIRIRTFVDMELTALPRYRRREKNQVAMPNKIVDQRVRVRLGDMLRDFQALDESNFRSRLNGWEISVARKSDWGISNVLSVDVRAVETLHPLQALAASMRPTRLHGHTPRREPSRGGVRPVLERTNSARKRLADFPELALTKSKNSLSY